MCLADHSFTTSVDETDTNFFIMKNIKAFLLLSFCIVFYNNAVAQFNQQYFEKVLAEYYEADEPGVTLLVAQKGKILYKGGRGMANMELQVPLQSNHVLRLGSITKQFTSVAILMLMEEGKLGLQDDITKFLPDYPTLGKTITIEHLLTHTSGIQSMTDMSGFFDNVRNDMTTDEMLASFQNEPMNFEPGESFRYNNSGYFLLGVIIEKISGMTYADFIQKRIFDKVGMKDSYYGNAGQIIPRRASGYERNADGYENAPYLSMTIPYAAGSLLSTVEDLYKWHKAVFSYQLISKASLNQAHTIYIPKDGTNPNYGYGWGIADFFGQKMIGHSGGINGFITNELYLPAEDVFVAAFSNGGDNPNRMTERIAAELIGEYTVKSTIVMTSEQLKEYEGVFAIQDSPHERVIRVEGNHLTSMRTGSELFHIFPFEKDKFYFKKSLTIFEFKRDEIGKIVGMLAHRQEGKPGIAKKTGQPKEQKIVQLDEKTMKQYVGEYKMEAGFVITVVFENNNLFAAPPGEPKLKLNASSKTSFFLKEMDANVTFEKGDKGAFSIMNLDQGGRKMKGIKK